MQAIRPSFMAAVPKKNMVPLRKPQFAGTGEFKFDKFHAHVYFDKKTKPIAESIQAAIPGKFPGVTVGKLHDKPVGPHPKPMFALYFDEPHFSALTQWFMENRQGLSVLIHPETQDDMKDHTERPLWLGKPVKLKLDLFG